MAPEPSCSEPVVDLHHVRLLCLDGALDTDNRRLDPIEVVGVICLFQLCVSSHVRKADVRSYRDRGSDFTHTSLIPSTR